MLEESIMNPITQGNVSSVNSAGKVSTSTIYHILKDMAAEISEGIVNLSDGKRWLVEEELKRLKLEAYQQTSAEAVYTLLLFRKYAAIANEIKDSKDKGGEWPLGELTFTSEEKNDSRLLVGFDAAKTNIFWFRLLAAIFSFICFVVMSTVPYVGAGDYRPSNQFHHQCRFEYDLDGYFNMRPYQMVIIFASLAYLYCMVTAIYYLLPINGEGVKYIPGLDTIIVECAMLGATNSDRQEQRNRVMMATNRVYGWLRKAMKFGEFFLDFLMVLTLILTFLISSISLERSSKFFYHNQQTSLYFTLGSFFSTFSNTTPQCLEEDPTPRIRASIAMLFFSIVTLALCLQVTYRSYQQEMTLRRAPGADGRICDDGIVMSAEEAGGGDSSGGMGGRPFYSLPVPTSEEDEEDEEKHGREVYRRHEADSHRHVREDEIQVKFSAPNATTTTAAATAAAGAADHRVVMAGPPVTSNRASGTINNTSSKNDEESLFEEAEL